MIDLLIIAAVAVVGVGLGYWLGRRDARKPVVVLFGERE